MSQNATIPPASKSRRARASRRSAWLKFSIVASSIMATLSGAQAIAWLERTSRVDELASTPAVVALAAQALPSASTPTGGAVNTAPFLSILGILPTVTPATKADAVPVVPIIPNELSAATPAPTATPTMAPTTAPMQMSRPVRHITRSRSSR